MKNLSILAMVVGAVLPCAQLRAELHNFTVASGTIPDGDLNGKTFIGAISGSPIAAGQITSITVGLNISGDWTGDLYGYLTHDGSSAAILLNRVGRVTGNLDGFGDAGFIVSLSDVAPGPNIHDVTAGGGVLTGTFKPDGRNFDPLTVLGDVNSPNTTLMGALGGQDVNGNWSLFLADVVSGGANGLNSWSLAFNEPLSGVPEPTNVAMAVFAFLLVGVKGAAWFWDRRAMWKSGY